MGIERRIENIEKQTGANKAKPVWIVVVYDDTGKPSEAELEKAKAEYKKEHPDWQGQDFNVIWVMDAETKELLGKAGERTKNLIVGEGTESV